MSSTDSSSVDERVVNQDSSSEDEPQIKKDQIKENVSSDDSSSDDEIKQEQISENSQNSNHQQVNGKRPGGMGAGRKNIQYQMMEDNEGNINSDTESSSAPESQNETQPPRNSRPGMKKMPSKQMPKQALLSGSESDDSSKNNMADSDDDNSSNASSKRKPLLSESENTDKESAKNVLSSEADSEDNPPPAKKPKTASQRNSKAAKSFLDMAAESTSESDDEMVDSNKKKQVKKKKKREALDSSDEEDDEDASDADETGNVAGLIDDDVEEDDADNESDDDDSGSPKKKKKRKKVDLELDDDDLDLVEEATGKKVKRFNRLKMSSDSEDSDTAAQKSKPKPVDAIGGSETSDAETSGDEVVKSRLDIKSKRPKNSDDSDDGSEDEFIVDRKESTYYHQSEGMQEALEVFGNDFDFENFDKEDLNSDSDDSDDDAQFERQYRQPKQKSEKTIYDMFEPEDLEKGFYTEKDKLIRINDIPERFQLRRIPVQPAGTTDKPDDMELNDEATWIVNQAFHNTYVSDQRSLNQREENENEEPPVLGAPLKRNVENQVLMKTVNHVLNYIRNHKLEVPFIAQYRQEYLTGLDQDKLTEQSRDNLLLNQRELMKIYNYDEKWLRLKSRKNKVREILQQSRRYQQYKLKQAQKQMDKQNAALNTANSLTTANLDDINSALNTIKDNEKSDDLIGSKSPESGTGTLSSPNLQSSQTLLPNTTDNLIQALPDNVRLITEDDMDKVEAIQTTDDLNDLNDMIRLYYGDVNERRAKSDSESDEEDEDALNSDSEHSTSRKKKNELEDEDDPLMKHLPNDIENVRKKQNKKISQFRKKRSVTIEKMKICYKYNIHKVVERFGLSPEKLGENLRDGYPRHAVEQDPKGPLEVAAEYVSERFTTPEEVLEAARFMLVTCLAHEPNVRQAVRKAVFDRALVHVRPTRLGMKQIQQEHICWAVRFITNKPVNKLVRTEYMHMIDAKEQSLLEVQLTMERINSDGSKIDDADMDLDVHQDRNYKYDVRDLFTSVGQYDGDQWNDQRSTVIFKLLEDVLYPKFIQQLHRKLLDESKEGIIERCAEKFVSYINKGKWLSEKIEDPEEDKETENHSSDESDYEGDPMPGRTNANAKGQWVISIMAEEDRNASALGYAVLLTPSGEVADHIKLENYFSCYGNRDTVAKKQKIDLKELSKFIVNRKPSAIFIGVNNVRCKYLKNDILKMIGELKEQSRRNVRKNLNCYLTEPDVACIWSQTKTAEDEFPEFHIILRRAIGLGRHVLDPLSSICQLYNDQEDILCLRLDKNQENVDKSAIRKRIEDELVIAVNQTGVNINTVLANKHMQRQLQFVSGLGPRKATNLIKLIKNNGNKLENRMHLVTKCSMTPQIFVNCSGFLRIQQDDLIDSQNDVHTNSEILDSTRIHPIDYVLARHLINNALDIDEEDSQANQHTAEEIFDESDKLEEIDLVAFASELEKQPHHGQKLCTLQMMKQEIMNPYFDFRETPKEPSSERLFKLITGEDAQSLWPGKPVTGIVKQFVRRKPTEEELDGAEADAANRQDNETWLCKYCDLPFEELPALWKHIDDRKCEGRAMGIRVELDCGISGFCKTMFMSSQKITRPEDRVAIGQIVHFKILNPTQEVTFKEGKTKTYHNKPIDFDRLTVNLTCRSEDLKNTEDADPECDLDEYFDQTAAEDMKRKERLARKGITEDEEQTNRAKYYIRNIDHPNFMNIPREQAYTKLLEEFATGEPIFRPSSKGINYINASFKIDDSPLPIIIDQIITEDPAGKDSRHITSLSTKLLIDNEEFEDLDEVIARYISALIGNIEDLKRYKYYFTPADATKNVDDFLIQEAKAYLIDKKQANPKTIPYTLSLSRKFPGKCILQYLPNTEPKHIYVYITHNGFTFAQQRFPKLSTFIQWFKNNYNRLSQLCKTRTPSIAPSSGEMSASGLRGAETPRSSGRYTPNSTISLTPSLNDDYAAESHFGGFATTIVSGSRYTPEASFTDLDHSVTDYTANRSRNGSSKGRSKFNTRQMQEMIDKIHSEDPSILKQFARNMENTSATPRTPFDHGNTEIHSTATGLGRMSSAWENLNYPQTPNIHESNDGSMMPRHDPDEDRYQDRKRYERSDDRNRDRDRDYERDRGRDDGDRRHGHSNFKNPNHFERRNGYDRGQDRDRRNDERRRGGGGYFRNGDNRDSRERYHNDRGRGRGRGRGGGYQKRTFDNANFRRPERVDR